MSNFYGISFNTSSSVRTPAIPLPTNTSFSLSIRENDLTVTMKQDESIYHANFRGAGNSLLLQANRILADCGAGIAALVQVGRFSLGTIQVLILAKVSS